MVNTAGRALATFADELERLRCRAGGPSLHQLVALTAGLSRPLARTTISDKLNAKSLPDWEFVASFVAGCAEHARRTGVPLDPDSADLRVWDARHLDLLRAVDAGRDNARLASTAAAQIARRAGPATPATGPARDARPDDPGPHPSGVPRHLPATVPHFVGRTDEIAVLRRAAGRPRGGPTIVCVAGAAGVGKTSLVLHWAHQAVADYPDGQLYVDLRGFHPHASAVTAAEALHHFLEAFGVAPQQIPSTVDARAARYRGLLADRRVLVVLDNALDDDQVRPLLPASPGCLVVVTSRRRMSALIAGHGAESVTLGVFSPAQSRELLVSRLAAGRATRAARPGDDLAVDDIARLCAHLPLALCVVAARAVTHPTFDLAALADELRRARGALDVLGDGELDVRVALSWSYRLLSPPAAAMFRLLGLHPATEITTAAGASLAGVDLSRARSALAELARVHLVEEVAPGRYGHHDLLRAYAAELAEADVAEADRRAAVRRVLDHYARTAVAAAMLVSRHRVPDAVREPEPGVTPAVLDGAEEALAWLAAERTALLAAVTQAAASGFDEHAVELAWALFEPVNRQGHWSEAVSAQLTAVVASHRLGDKRSLAFNHFAVGLSFIHLDREDEAMLHLREALTQYEAIDDPAGQAGVHMNLGGLHNLRGRHGEALHHARCALPLYEAAAHHAGRARAITNIGWCHAELGDHDTAITHCRRALELLHALGDPQGEADAWEALGYTYQRMRRHAEAERCFRTGLVVARRAGDRCREAELLTRLGDTAAAEHQVNRARSAWHRALSILDEVGHPQADRLRGRLGTPVATGR
jgi:tetratricopeptide (TPR) repeat protein